MISLTSTLNAINFEIPGRRWQLFEFADLSIIPAFIAHDQHDSLSARWTRRIPFFQPHSPAELAADVLLETLQTLQEEDVSARWTVIDFCSGSSGGPIPTMEMLVNHGRFGDDDATTTTTTATTTGSSAGEIHPTIPFILSDPRPNLDAWMSHCGRSRNLGFLPQPVSAAGPPFAAISATTKGNWGEAREKGYQVKEEKRVMRTFCQAFHRFDDNMAVKALKSTMDTSDAVVIVELQERRIWSFFVAPVLEVAWTMIMAVFWFWRDGMHLFCTYVLPILPLTQFFDAVISCLRTRTFEEMMWLVERAQGKDGEETGRLVRNEHEACFGEWHFAYSRKLYAWPVGYITVITGRRVKLNAR